MSFWSNLKTIPSKLRVCTGAKGRCMTGEGENLLVCSEYVGAVVVPCGASAQTGTESMVPWGTKKRQVVGEVTLENRKEVLGTTVSSWKFFSQHLVFSMSIIGANWVFSLFVGIQTYFWWAQEYVYHSQNVFESFNMCCSWPIKTWK